MSAFSTGSRQPSPLSPTQKVLKALAELRAGRMIIVSDSEDRECEGDFVMAAALVQPDDVNQMAREGRGLICCPIDGETQRRLDLQVQLDDRFKALHGTAFTQSLDLIEGTSTGISASDRAATLRRLANLEARAADFARPGHIFPIVARDGGVLEREGHTEASVDLCRLAGLRPAAVICEIMNPDGSMAYGDRLRDLADRLSLCLISVEDIIHFRRETEVLVMAAASARLPSTWGEFYLHHLNSPFGESGRGIEVITRGQALSCLPAPTASTQPLLLRLHSECLTGDLFASRRCDCGQQLEESLRLLGQEEEAALVYLHQEGRGIGLTAKLQAYVLQDQGLDTVDANLKLGFEADQRDYWEAAQALKLMGRTRVRLLTNNPAKARGLEAYGIEVCEMLPLKVPANAQNEGYLKTKRERLGHTL